jgi:hypothetical protein
VRHRQERHLLVGAPAGTPEAPLVPAKPPELSWRDFLVMLLQIGAEIEHALMVEYLYAAYSLGGSQIIPAGSRKLVRDWSGSILTVAKEEMGHLLTVQNLLILLGGAPTFEREDYPWSSPYYPFPFCLEKLSLESLACYVYAEMEPDMPASGPNDPPEWQHFESQDRAMIEKIVTDRVKDAGWEAPHHVGEVYNSILGILEDPTLVPDSCFDADTYSRQASWDEWGQGYRPRKQDTGEEIQTQQPDVIVVQMASRTEAIAGLKAIAGQGEAPHLRGPRQKGPSHFDRFVSIFQAFETAKDPTLVRPVPLNPSTRDPTQGGTGTYISSLTSRTWANLFNVRYRLLLAYLAHTYRLPRTDGDRGARAPMLQRVFAEMFNIKTIAEILVRLPLTDVPTDTARAGAPFEMPYTTVLPADDADCWQLYRDLLETSRELAAALLATKPQGEGADYLLTLRDLDEGAIAWLDQLLAGRRRGRLVHA